MFFRRLPGFVPGNTWLVAVHAPNLPSPLNLSILIEFGIGRGSFRSFLDSQSNPRLGLDSSAFRPQRSFR